MHLGAALIYSFIEVELLIGCGGFTAYQFLTNSECYIMFTSSEGLGAKVQVREGKNPDHQLRSSSPSSVENDVGVYRQPGGWLRSSHPLKSA